jgi:hypothetical protein
MKEFKDYCDILCDKKINFIKDNNIFTFENSFKKYAYITFMQSLTDSINSIKSAYIINENTNL